MAFSRTAGGSPTRVKRQATSLEEEEEEAKEEVQKYTFFNRKLREEADKNGDIYDEKLSTTRKEWAIPRYAKHAFRTSKRN